MDVESILIILGLFSAAAFLAWVLLITLEAHPNMGPIPVQERWQRWLLVAAWVGMWPLVSAMLVWLIWFWEEETDDDDGER